MTSLSSDHYLLYACAQQSCYHQLLHQCWPCPNVLDLSHDNPCTHLVCPWKSLNDDILIIIIILDNLKKPAPPSNNNNGHSHPGVASYTELGGINSATSRSSSSSKVVGGTTNTGTFSSMSIPSGGGALSLKPRLGPLKSSVSSRT